MAYLRVSFWALLAAMLIASPEAKLRVRNATATQSNSNVSEASNAIAQSDEVNQIDDTSRADDLSEAMQPAVTLDTAADDLDTESTAEDALPIEDSEANSTASLVAGDYETLSMEDDLGDLDDPADDARAEAGAPADGDAEAGAWGKEFEDDDVADHTDAAVPEKLADTDGGVRDTSAKTIEKATGAINEIPADDEDGVYNMETGSFEADAALVQTGRREVDDADTLEESSEDSDENGESEDVEEDGESEQRDEDLDEDEQAANDESDDESADVGDSSEDEDSSNAEDDSDKSASEANEAADGESIENDATEEETEVLEAEAQNSEDEEIGSEQAAFLQQKAAEDDDEDVSDNGDSIEDDARVGDKDAEAVEAEAVKESGGEEDEEKRVEREEAEQEEVESMEADSEYDFDGMM